ncbi:sulfite exporter TauE/SafE family protein [Sphingomonas sp. PL-96]|uniref:sulfite exporter TauE/SafE family protein n=1 Tax=Sphingomonas sp. PL-96 TaxID=2887201 RepID=UPI001E301A47|nr:sulfite exporter TauE/SafE family protein [Sphingomonas sp. PL-96]MCC2977216.1 sulfite exporter TauE/SafE family protein [Sphingomonas sp. PL-96]
MALAGAAGCVGGAMNALAGGGAFATMPALIGIGLPSTVANATSNVALQPAAMASAWTYRRGLAPLGGVPIRLLNTVNFIAALAGSYLLVVTPPTAFDAIVPWLLLFAFGAIAAGQRGAAWLRARVTIGATSLIAAQLLLGIYGGYFGGGIGMMMTAVYGLLVGTEPKHMAAPRTLILATANFAAAIVFVAFGLVAWWACVPMLLGGIAGGLGGAWLGERLSPRVIRLWTLAVTGVTTAVFFWRAYG